MSITSNMIFYESLHYYGMLFFLSLDCSLSLLLYNKMELGSELRHAICSDMKSDLMVSPKNVSDEYSSMYS